MGTKVCFVAFVLALAISHPAHPQAQPSISATLSPNLVVPLGNSAEYYSLGYGAALSGRYDVASIFSIRAGLDAGVVPTLGGTNLLLFALAIGPDVEIPLPLKLRLSMFATGGWYLGLHEGQSGSNPFVKGGAEISYELSPSFGIGLGAYYSHYFAAGPALLGGLSAELGASYRFGRSARPPALKIRAVDLPPLFPVFYKYYDDHPFGNVTVVNEDPEALTGVTVSFLLSRYMEQAQVCARIERLAPREQRTVPLYALLTEDILEITEATKISGQLLLAYTQQETARSTQEAVSVRLNDRNAMSWDDNRKAAAFVSAKDPEVLLVSKQIAGLARKSGNDSLPSEMKVAVAMWQALREIGIKYVPDPKTPYVEFSRNAEQVDFLQFPVQTLVYKAGDCDDLSILYSALLESVGIETAFVTVPGHIYMAFACSLAPREADRLLQAGRTFFVRDDRVWIPVEITALEDDFVEANQAGATQWRQYEPVGKAGFHPVHDAWKTYEPVGFVRAAAKPAAPSIETVGRRFEESMGRLRGSLLQPKLAALRSQLSSDPDNVTLRSRLGLLYARFGMLKEAEGELTRALRAQEDGATLVNLGNLYFLAGNYAKARATYTRAARRLPASPQVILALARCNFAEGNLEESERLLTDVERLDPELASQYAYLRAGESGAARAGTPTGEENVTWMDE